MRGASVCICITCKCFVCMHPPPPPPPPPPLAFCEYCLMTVVMAYEMLALNGGGKFGLGPSLAAGWLCRRGVEQPKRQRDEKEGEP